jgi:hypothetical protein
VKLGIGGPTNQVCCNTAAILGTFKGSFPLIAKPNSQARCRKFHPITIFESTRCKLASWLLWWVEKRLNSGLKDLHPPSIVPLRRAFAAFESISVAWWWQMVVCGTWCCALSHAVCGGTLSTALI